MEITFCSFCKRRNELFKIRERVVKIQKAILRWKPKSRGLRGFQPKLRALESEYDFLRIGQKQKYVGVEEALARNPEGQEQYMRLVGKFEKVLSSLVLILPIPSYAQEFQKTSSKTLPWLGVAKMDTHADIDEIRKEWSSFVNYVDKSDSRTDTAVDVGPYIVRNSKAPDEREKRILKCVYHDNGALANTVVAHTYFGSTIYKARTKSW
ncbi:hypothetical protein Lser_V15G41296 [Lactuca serriola]